LKIYLQYVKYTYFHNYITQFTQYSSFTRDENWKVMRCILEKFIPPPKPDGELGGLMIPALVADLPPLPSPRSKRAAEAAAALLNPGEAALLNMEPQDRFGMRSRSINDLIFFAVSGF
jgi:hypothetical protein